ncbi:MAG: hypothetical protein IJF15_07420 [Oscillospiraceae bacterium]|nr:hypothetical protein [Oscillospiraceae bacterium]
MRIAIPVENENVSPRLAAAAFRIFEDDHGKIVRRNDLPCEGEGAAAAVALLEDTGADVLIVGALDAAERTLIARAGIMPFTGVTGGAEAAALAFLGGVIVFDEANTCNACGHGHACSLDCESCGEKTSH